MTATIDNGKLKYLLPIIILVASHGDCITSEQNGIDRFIEFERQSRTSIIRYISKVYSSCMISEILIMIVYCYISCERAMHAVYTYMKFGNHLDIITAIYVYTDIPFRWHIMATYNNI